MEQEIETKMEEQEATMEQEVNVSGQNIMRNIEIEKIVLNCGATEDKLEKSVKLLEMITKRKVYKIKATKRIPAFGISPGKLAGGKVTIRNKEQINDLLRRCFVTIDNEFPKKQIVENQASFGIPEYIEIPGLDYDRDIGILGFEISIIFKRKGKSVGLKKIKRGSIPLKQRVTPEEIKEYLIKNFGVEIVEKKGGKRY
jgi:large subunit ribosomal protein L5